MKLLASISEGQVLQRIGKHGACARLTGTTEVTGDICATLSKGIEVLRVWRKSRILRSVGSRFDFELKGIPSGGPYRLTLSIGNGKRTLETLIIRSFFVGDVWLLAGQSNMEGCGHKALGTATPHPLIRAFSLAREWRQATDPLHVPWESPDATLNEGKPFTREQAEDYRRTCFRGVGMGIFFAHEMLARSGVPQGLVCASRGATRMEQWDPDLKNRPEGSLYGAMLSSMKATGQPCAGILWYQGESDNAPAFAAVYTERMRKLVTAVRRDLSQPGLPWIIGQLSRVFGERPLSHWNSVQEQQRLLASKIKNLDMVATIDLPLDDFIHISATAFPRLASRFARVADRLVYRNLKEPTAPALRSISPLKMDPITGAGWIDVSFKNIAGGLRSSGNPHGFSLVNADERELPFIYKTSLHGDSVRLHILPEAQSAELRLSYGHGHAPFCNITDARDFSLPVFGPHPVPNNPKSLAV